MQEGSERVLLLLLFLLFVFGGVSDHAPSYENGPPSYRDFFVRLPVKDYRKKYGKEVYRYPRMKALIVHSISDAESTNPVSEVLKLTSPMYTLDGITFYSPQHKATTNGVVNASNLKYYNLEDVCWSTLKENIRDKKYNLILFAPSENLSDMDAIVLKRLFESDRPTSSPIRILFPLQQRSLGIDMPFTYIQNMDMYVVWNSRPAAGATEISILPPQRCSILYTMDRVLTAKFLKRLLVVASFISRPFDHMEVSRVVFLDDIELTVPSRVFLDLDASAFVKTSYGWEVLKWNSIMHQRFVEKYYLILRVPVSILSSTVYENNLPVLESSFPGNWSFACESRSETFSGSKHTLEIDEICHRNKRPITVHPDLLISDSIQSYNGPYSPPYLIQVWKGEDWKDVLERAVKALDIEIIDQFYWSIQFGQLYMRQYQPQIFEGYTITDRESTWSPPVGVISPVELGLHNFQEEMHVEVLAVDDAQKKALIRSRDGRSFEVSFEVMPEIQLDIRQGDDMGVISDLYTTKYNADQAGPFSYTFLSDHFPGFDSVEAVKARRPSIPAYLQEGDADIYNVCSIEASKSACSGFRVERLMNLSLQSYCLEESSEEKLPKDSKPKEDDIGSPLDDKITIAMTTCRRLQHFLSVAQDVDSFVSSFSRDYEVEVVVVDDGSSSEDREAMVEAYPRFTYIFKSTLRRGHASSLNMILRYVDTRFLVYLEDDWKALSSPRFSIPYHRLLQKRDEDFSDSIPIFQRYLHDSVRLSIQIIKNSLEVPTNASQREPVAQVFLNDQHSWHCSTGKVLSPTSGLDDVCNLDDLGRGGWYREASIPRQDGPSGASDERVIPYSFHEFGLRYEKWYNRIHSKSVWPGLGLNPAVWDLHQIRGAWARSVHCSNDEMTGNPLYSSHNFNHNNIVFEEDHDAFEHVFSLRGYISGLNVAYLPAVHFEHIGDDISAYLLNNMTRPWERS